MRTLVLAALAGCSPGLDVTVQVDPDHPTVVHLSFDPGAPGTSTVRFEHAGSGREHEAPAHTADGAHAHRLLGLKAGEEYRWEVRFDGADGSRARATGTVAAGALPDRIPTFSVTTLVPEQAQMHGNYVMFAASNGAGVNSPDSVFFIGILDHEGDFVWWHELPEGLGTVTGTPSLDGDSLFWTEYDESRTNPDGRIIRMTLDGEVLSTTYADGAHHATVELGDGRFAYLGRVFASLDDGNTAMTDTLVVNQEGATTAGETVFDFIEDWWKGVENFPWEPCGGSSTVFRRLYGYRNVCELTHTNSLVYERSEPAFYLYPRKTDATLKLDAAGELVWQIGGAWSDFTLPGGGPVQTDVNRNELWSQGHFSDVRPGTIVMFDNAMHTTPQVSALAEYTFDETTRTIDEVWRHPDPDGGYTSHLGDVRKLSQGNYFSSWMTLERIDEVTPQGETVFEMRPDRAGIHPRRIFLLEDLYDLSQIGTGRL